MTLVKPDASPEEVKAVVDDVQGGQIFQQALMSSNRYGESRVAYREVQERHEEIKRIEQTLTELAQLFNDVRERFSLSSGTGFWKLTTNATDEHHGRAAE